jgi:hypothetical protein
MSRPQPIRRTPGHPRRRSKRLTRNYPRPALFRSFEHESMVAQPPRTSAHAIMNEESAKMKMSEMSAES